MQFVCDRWGRTNGVDRNFIIIRQMLLLSRERLISRNITFQFQLNVIKKCPWLLGTFFALEVKWIQLTECEEKRYTGLAQNNCRMIGT